MFEAVSIFEKGIKSNVYFIVMPAWCSVFFSGTCMSLLKCQLTENFMNVILSTQAKLANTIELQWLEHLWDHANKFETGVVRANEG